MQRNYDFWEMVNALIGGGWTSEDKEGLMEEYGFTDEEAETICLAMEEINDESVLSRITRRSLRPKALEVQKRL